MGDARGVIHVQQRRISRFEQQLGVVITANTDIDAGAGALESNRGLAGVFERLPRAFEENAVLRIRDFRFARIHAEERSIE